MGLSDETHRWLPWILALTLVVGLIGYGITLIAKDPDSMHECDQMCHGYDRRGPKSYRSPTATEAGFCECFPPKDD